MSALQGHSSVIADLCDDLEAMAGPSRVALLERLETTRNWMNAREAELLRLVERGRNHVDAGARDITQLVQQQARVGFGEAKRRALRATWSVELTDVMESVAGGELPTAHADEIFLLADRLPAEHRSALRHRLVELIGEIAPLTPFRARRHLAEFEREFDDDDGDSRLERQRRSNRFAMPKRPGGAVGLSGELDPVSAEYVRNAVHAKIEEMWRRERRGRDALPVPEGVLTNDQRRAAALVELVRAGAAAAPGSAGRAEIIVQIDHQTLLGQLSASPIARLGGGETIPASEARRLACDAGILPVVLGGPSQPLDVGRVSRLATSAQRAALRAVHESCCITGCDVPFDYCEIHHITWWRHGGASDLDNLVPVCSKHHHLIHHERWQLTVDAERVGRLTHRRSDPSRSSAPAKRSPARSDTYAAAPRSRPRSKPPSARSRTPEPVRPIPPMRC